MTNVISYREAKDRREFQAFLDCLRESLPAEACERLVADIQRTKERRASRGLVRNLSASRVPARSGSKRGVAE